MDPKRRRGQEDHRDGGGNDETGTPLYANGTEKRRLRGALRGATSEKLTQEFRARGRARARAFFIKKFLTNRLFPFIILIACRFGTLELCGFYRFHKLEQGGNSDEENLPAQEKTEIQRARFPEENGYLERQKSSEEKTRKGQSTTHLLSAKTNLRSPPFGMIGVFLYRVGQRRRAPLSEKKER